mgnify:CR=1 FL=1
MKTMNKIIAILGIALLAIATVGAVSAEPVERTVLGNAWIYDIGVTDDFDYFIYDGTSDVASYSIGAWNYTPAPVPVIPDYELRSINEVIGDWDVADHDSASETHDDPSADHADDHSDSESKNINTGLNRDRF